MGDDLLISTLVPLWLKVAWTAMVLAIVVIYWRHKGPANFLWFSDIAFLSLVAGLWFESSFIVSLMACMVLVPEALWTLSFFGRLLRQGLGLLAVVDQLCIGLGLRSGRLRLGFFDDLVGLGFGVRQYLCYYLFSFHLHRPVTWD